MYAMQVLVRICLFALSIAAVVIGIMIYGVGPHRTATIFSHLLAAIGLENSYSGDLNTPNTSSEMRFFAVFWAAYGVFIFQTTRATKLVKTKIWIILGLFFLGGVGRVIGIAQGDTPDGLFVGLMWVELIAPLAVGAMALRLPNNADHPKAPA